MDKIKPKKLNKGDTIGILAVSGKINDIGKVNNAKKFLEQQGYSVVVSDTCKTFDRYLAGKSKKERIDSFHNFFLDDSIDAILCARGGYGTLKLIDEIDWNIVKNHPKIFAGYSDITVLLAMMYKKCGLIGFHSAMAKGDLGDVIDNYTKDSFFNVLEGSVKHIEANYPNTYYSGIAHGILWGGNLASLASLCGIDFIPDEDIVLFIEDVNEPAYKIDRMLTQLFNIDKFRNNVKGIALGDFLNVGDGYALKYLFKEISNNMKIPVADGFKITHAKTKDTIPYGVRCLFDAEQGRIAIQDSYVIC